MSRSLLIVGMLLAGTGFGVVSSAMLNANGSPLGAAGPATVEIASSSVVNFAAQDEDLSESAATDVDPDPIVSGHQIILDEFETEAREDTWASPTEATILQVLGEDVLQSPVIEALECKATMCRVTTRHATQDGREAYLEHLTNFSPFNTHGMIGPHPDDPLGVVVVFAREGHILPTMEGADGPELP